MRWDQICRVTAFKRDLVTTDLLVLERVLDGGAVYLLDEEMPGYPAVEAALSAALGLPSHWRGTVLFPAFAANRQVVFERRR